MEVENALIAASDNVSALSATNIWTNKDAIDQLARAANAWAKSNIIPQNYQGNTPNCMVALEMSSRMGVSPMIVMQNMYVVKGKPSWSGQACIMLINNCGKFTDVKHIYTGEKGTDNRGCYVTAVRIADGEKVDGVEVTMSMAKAEGWISNPKWKNMPELMLAYRAAAFFARINCPEALMGAHTVEEMQDISGESRNAAADLTDALRGGGNDNM